MMLIILFACFLTGPISRPPLSGALSPNGVPECNYVRRYCCGNKCAWEDTVVHEK